MTKTTLAILSVFALTALVGTTVGIAVADKPDVVIYEQEDLLPFNHNLCGTDNTVHKSFVFTLTNFGKDNFKLELNDSYQIFDGEELIGEGKGTFKQQGKYSDSSTTTLNTSLNIKCFNGEKNEIIHSGYTITPKGVQHNHGK